MSNNPFAPHKTDENGETPDLDLEFADKQRAEGTGPSEAPLEIELGTPEGNGAADAPASGESPYEINLPGATPAESGHPVSDEGAMFDPYTSEPHAGEPASMEPAPHVADAALSPGEVPLEGMAGETMPPMDPEAEASEITAKAPPEALPVDPVWLASFVASLGSAREMLASLRTSWDGRPMGTVEGSELSNAVSALEQEHAELLERVRGYNLAPPEDVPAPEVESKEKAFGFDEGPAPAIASSGTKRRGSGGGGESAMIWQLVQVVLGGLLAIPAAQLILWWLPFGLARDPLKLAPQLPGWASFLAPDDMRGGLPPSPQPMDGPGGNGPKVAKNGKNGKPKKQTDPDALPMVGANNPEIIDPDAGPKTLPAPMIDPILPIEDPNALPKVGPPVPPPPALKPWDGVKDPALATSDELHQKIEVLELRLKAYEAAPADDEAKQKAAYGALYTAATEMAKTRTFADPEGKLVDDRIGRAHAQITGLLSSDSRLDKMGRTGAIWAKQTSRKNQDGVLLVGTVKEIKPAGRYFEIRVECRNSAGLGMMPEAPPVVLSVLSSTAPRNLDPGAEVFVLGSVILEPKTNLTAYGGEEERVVWRGSMVEIPK